MKKPNTFQQGFPSLVEAFSTIRFFSRVVAEFLKLNPSELVINIQYINIRYIYIHTPIVYMYIFDIYRYMSGTSLILFFTTIALSGRSTLGDLHLKRVTSFG